MNAKSAKQWQTPELNDSYHYDQIAAAIAFIRQHRGDQPNLSQIAQQVGLSDYHFQRLFTQWAGISPKRFVQYLTLERAKATILETRSLLELSTDVGLSGPSRLHDLFVTIEAMSPGEFKTGGQGLEIRYGLHSTPFGMAAIATTKRGLCALQFWDDASIAVADWLADCWPQATLIEDVETTRELCDRIFHPIEKNLVEKESEEKTSKEKTPEEKNLEEKKPSTRALQPLTLLVKGTNFQLQVWRALLQIPPGGLTTYQTIADIIDRPKAVRAVGSAIGKNPIGYLIPCHRVIRSSGEMGGYRWGLDRKQVILGWEASRKS
ncbi:MAG: methylated-DNA--[protein]-cysteine S-methyltransferase [Cyanobacteria bacterium J06621_11]